ncbi:hypothetical protein BU23DRAFT_563874 [Bimuria novae-zelandiae CBS 107.79]|uniref:Uncharacterized protein n=1 Tax=Bimuria novae-zelandiae CBS 107.79 TaxID=1447943 RepID=A0A6A5VTG9_9PLEO|nr:hypothetical protein BU23DRAFT_563874 [Bimuria novae-zelandiae CBS 107.79]
MRPTTFSRPIDADAEQKELLICSRGLIKYAALKQAAYTESVEALDAVTHRHPHLGVLGREGNLELRACMREAYEKEADLELKTAYNERITEIGNWLRADEAMDIAKARLKFTKAPGMKLQILFEYAIRYKIIKKKAVANGGIYDPDYAGLVAAAPHRIP